MREVEGSAFCLRAGKGPGLPAPLLGGLPSKQGLRGAWAPSSSFLPSKPPPAWGLCLFSEKDQPSGSGRECLLSMLPPPTPGLPPPSCGVRPCLPRASACLPTPPPSHLFAPDDSCFGKSLPQEVFPGPGEARGRWGLLQSRPVPRGQGAGGSRGCPTRPVLLGQVGPARLARGTASTV